ncbi:Hypothetical predicted protein [Mytilus galloprovincialis]|uniref:Uncharacterized protein n=1 Tax=Mytilus galloprovincialis TaxID=29158 RepID=A0A8B6FHL9_MYTGA|nr:Hypothetical predicted protein [Mytilus galloprovincialis]
MALTRLAVKRKADASVHVCYLCKENHDNGLCKIGKNKKNENEEETETISHDVLEKKGSNKQQKKETQRDISITEISSEVIHSYRTNVSVVTKLFGSISGHLLLSDEACEHTFQTIKVDGPEIYLKSETKNIKVFDITEIKKSEFILSFVDDTFLKRMSSKGSLRKFLDFSPLLPRALQITASGHLLMSVREQGEAFPLNSKSCRQLIVMDLKGKPIHTYEYSNKRKRLFSLVVRIATSSKGDIYLVDRETIDGHGCVAALSYPNKIKWRYSGNNNITSDRFCPGDIIIRNSDTIIVTDVDNALIHILNISGLVTNYIDTSKQGISFPYMICLGVDELLWIGCSTQEEDTSDRAMLYSLKY